MLPVWLPFEMSWGMGGQCSLLLLLLSLPPATPQPPSGWQGSALTHEATGPLLLPFVFLFSSSGM